MKKKYVAPSFGCVCIKTSALIAASVLEGGAEELRSRLDCQLIIAGMGDNLSDAEAMEWLVTNKNGCHYIYTREENGEKYGECGDTDPAADLPAGKYLHVVRNGSGGYVATVVDQCDGGSSGYPGGSWPSFPWWQ